MISLIATGFSLIIFIALAFNLLKLRYLESRFFDNIPYKYGHLFVLSKQSHTILILEAEASSFKFSIQRKTYIDNLLNFIFRIKDISFTSSDGFTTYTILSNNHILAKDLIENCEFKTLVDKLLGFDQIITNYHFKSIDNFCKSELRFYITPGLQNIGNQTITNAAAFAAFIKKTKTIITTKSPLCIFNAYRLSTTIPAFLFVQTLLSGLWIYNTKNTFFYVTLNELIQFSFTSTIVLTLIVFLFIVSVFSKSSFFKILIYKSFLWIVFLSFTFIYTTIYMTNIELDRSEPQNTPIKIISKDIRSYKNKITYIVKAELNTPLQSTQISINVSSEQYNKININQDYYISMNSGFWEIPYIHIDQL